MHVGFSVAESQSSPHLSCRHRVSRYTGMHVITNLYDITALYIVNSNYITKFICRFLYPNSRNPTLSIAYHFVSVIYPPLRRINYSLQVDSP